MQSCGEDAQEVELLATSCCIILESTLRRFSTFCTYIYIQLRFYVESPLTELELLSVDVRENNAIEDHVRFNLIFIDNFEML